MRAGQIVATIIFLSLGFFEVTIAGVAISSIYLNMQDAVVRYQRLRDRTVIVRLPSGRRLWTGIVVYNG